MTNARVWPTGLAFNNVPGSANLTTLDILTSQSINGFVGGTWAPVSPIIIGGAGFQVTGVFDAANSNNIGVTGTLTVSGSIALSGTQVNASASIVQWQSGSFLTMAAGSTATFAGSVTLSGRHVLTRARVVMADANQTIDVTQGDRFTAPANNAAPRLITLKSTAPAVPNTGECMTVFWTPGTAGGAGTQYTFQREDATVVATLDGSGTADTGACWVEFEYYGGVWRLGASSGTPYDGTASYGVIAGPGA